MQEKRIIESSTDSSESTNQTSINVASEIEISSDMINQAKAPFLKLTDLKPKGPARLINEKKNSEAEQVKKTTKPLESRSWSTIRESKNEEKALTEKVLTWGEWISSWPAIKETLIHTVNHYKNGFKLLYFNVKMTSQILMRSLKGIPQTRRERQLLTRTLGDLFRLVPFIVIILVPFMELSIPFLLKWFPGILPSTFDDKLKKKENLKKQLHLKIEMAKFLQDTLVEIKNDKNNQNPEFGLFLEKLRTGEGVSTEDFVKNATVFKDELTLDNLQRNQLTAMCRLLGIKPFGIDSILRLQIERKVQSLKRDDRSIVEEGIDSLTTEELQYAVMARGMYSQTNNRQRLRERLEEWLDFSIRKNVPITLLLLSRAFALNAHVELSDALKDSIAHMPSELIDEIESRVGAPKFGQKLDRALKLQALEEYTALLDEERLAMQNQIEDPTKSSFEALATLADATELDRRQIEELRNQVMTIGNAATVDMQTIKTKMEAINAELDESEKIAKDDLLKRRASAETGLMTDEEFNKFWAAKRNEALKKQIAKQKENELQKKNAKKLEDKVVQLLNDLTGDLEVTRKEIRDDLKVLDKNYDGLISEDEIKFALKVLDSKLTESQIKNLIDKLDPDHDGLIEVERLFKVAKDMDIDLAGALVEARELEANIKAKTATVSD